MLVFLIALSKWKPFRVGSGLFIQNPIQSKSNHHLIKNTGYAPLEPEIWKMFKHNHAQMKVTGATKKTCIVNAKVTF